MDVQVIDVEEGMDHRGAADDGNAELNEGEVNAADNSTAHDEDGIDEPYVGMEFDSEESA